MKYANELKRSMNFLGQKSNSVFIGQAVEVAGTAMSNTLKEVPAEKLYEFPVTEEMQMGVTIGLLMQDFIPISIYPRWNFLLLAANQLINHLDKFNEMTKNKYKSKAIIRTSVGSEVPLHPQSQHVGDFSKAFKKISKTLNIVNLKKPEAIFLEYKKAYERKDGVSTILVEYGDFYNTK
tara:strand:+ start:217 stop:753 length:537 start_codon:yes stop_codon:yes gene_type:complete